MDRPFDPTKKWWLQGGFAPVSKEVTTTELSVKGSLPPQLSGLYVRNGSNPQSGSSTHWFFGDGMMHGVRLHGGKALWYRNRYVHTPLFDEHRGFDASGAPGGTTTQSNVSLVHHAGKLLSSGEVGVPFEIDPNDLRTIKPHTFAGKLLTNFTAHPKIDPATGYLHFFGYDITRPYLRYHVADASGRLISTQAVDVPGPTMMHDFAITERDVVFWDLPVVFDLKLALQWLSQPKSGALPFQWRPSHGARIGIMPLGGSTTAIKWYEIDPCYVFHGVNAYRDGDNVVIDVCRMKSVFNPNVPFIEDPSIHRWTVNTRSGKVSDDVISERPGEFPTHNPMVVGRKHRYAYFTETPYVAQTFAPTGLIKYDYATGRRETWDPGASRHAGEWFFVPDKASNSEDAGWLMTYLYDQATNSSEFVVVDATNVGRGPIASVSLPQRVPYGFHGTWVPDE